MTTCFNDYMFQWALIALCALTQTLLTLHLVKKIIIECEIKILAQIAAKCPEEPRTFYRIKISCSIAEKCSKKRN